MSDIIKSEIQTTLTPEQQSSIEKAFVPKIAEKNAVHKIYETLINAEITPEVCEQAGELLKHVVKIRTSTDRIRKAQKVYYLRAGQYVDASGNRIKVDCQEMEVKLSDLKNWYVNKEKERKEALQIERQEILSQYVENAHEIPLSGMTEKVWQAYLTAEKTTWQAEQDRLAQEELDRLERERVNQLQTKRREELLPLSSFWWEDLKLINLGSLTNEKYDNIHKILLDKKAKFDIKQAEIKAENERLQEEAAEHERKEQERIKRENRLNKIAKQRQQSMFALGVNAEFSTMKRLSAKEWTDLYTATKKAYDDEQEKKRLVRENEEKERAELEKIQAKKDAERKRLAAELEKRRQAEERARIEAEQARQYELNKSEADKMNDLRSDILSIFATYDDVFKSEVNVDKYQKVCKSLSNALNQVTGDIKF